MVSELETQQFKVMINRQRIRPRLWDYSYLLLRNNYRVFEKFRDLTVHEGKIDILDVGCGFKPWLQLFDQEKVKYIGVDFDKKLSSADFIGTANRLPFEDNSFDALIYSEVLEHVDDLQGALKEMNRVAKPNALVYISAPFAFPEHGVPHDFQRLTRYFYQKVFGSEILIFSESNGTFATALTSFNLFIESSPFRIFAGLKQIFFTMTNLLAFCSDAVINFVFNRIGRSYKKYFFMMPLGFAMIVRIKK